MSRGNDSISGSTRTFMPAPPAAEKKPKKVKAPKVSTPNKLPSLKLGQVVIAGLVLFSIFMFVQYRDAKHKLQTTGNQSSAAATQTASIVSRVQKLIILPQDETPTIVTVKDAAKLQGEAFYAAARNGDVTLVYTKSKKAILYRPSQNIIVNVANVSVSPAS